MKPIFGLNRIAHPARGVVGNAIILEISRRFTGSVLSAMATESGHMSR